MESPVDSIIKLPPWQRAVVWVFVAGFMGALWYFVWFADARESRLAAEAAERKAEAELVKMQAKLANFEEEQRKAAEMEGEIRKLMEELPTSAATVDNMMQTFQQQARMVGLNVESWVPGGEEKLDFYAKLPVDVRATGAWSAVGEFMRRVSEFRKIVSVEGLTLRVQSQEAGSAHPELEVSFRASTYRFLTDEERSPQRAGGAARRRRGGGAE